ncbi:hypothetical protein [Streptomyces sp. NPDC005752]
MLPSMEPVIKPTALIIDDTGFLKDGDASARRAAPSSTGLSRSRT